MRHPGRATLSTRRFRSRASLFSTFASRFSLHSAVSTVAHTSLASRLSVSLTLCSFASATHPATSAQTAQQHHCSSPDGFAILQRHARNKLEHSLSLSQDKTVLKLANFNTFQVHGLLGLSGSEQGFQGYPVTLSFRLASLRPSLPCDGLPPCGTAITK